MKDLRMVISPIFWINLKLIINQINKYFLPMINTVTLTNIDFKYTHV